MFASNSNNSESTSTLERIILKSHRACVLKSNGDGFGAYIERLINVAHDTHKLFPNIIKTLGDLIKHIREELQRTYFQYQFTIIIGKDFDYDQDLSNNFALIEHTGIKILIFSSIGTSYNLTTTTTANNIDDDQRPLSW